MEHSGHMVVFCLLLGSVPLLKSASRLVIRMKEAKGTVSAPDAKKLLSGYDLEIQKPRSAEIPLSFKKLEISYLSVYLIVMSADWMQGPYIYQLYSEYGYDKSQIATLFIVGFLSSMVTGTFVGAIADKYGRRLTCMLFCILYAIACFTKHSKLLMWLFVGRFLSGIATSILQTCFESWLIQENHQQAYPKTLLSLTLSKAMFLNGIVAIGAGIIANIAYDHIGPAGPFDISALLLLTALFLISTRWQENYGDTKIEIRQSLQKALSKMRNEPRIIVLGFVQALFEGSMYIFVFLWTPSLQETAAVDIPHGWIFACFMVCTMLGSQIFSQLLQLKQDVNTFLSTVFIVAAASLMLPSFTTNYTVRISCFFVFEICCGIFWPSIGTLRGQIVPDDVRSTVMNIFRVPLNLFVAVTLAYMDKLAMSTIWQICGAFLITAAAVQHSVKWNRRTPEVPIH